MRILRSVLLALLAVGIGACGSAAPVETDTAPSVEADASEGALPSDAPDPGSSAADDGGGTAGGSAEYCLNTVDQVAEALGVDVASAEGAATEGVGGACMYLAASGTAVYTVSVLDSDVAADAFEGYRDYEGAEEIAGIGDAALYLPLNDTFSIAFRKGGVVVSSGVTSSEVALTGDALRAAVEALSRQAADGL